MRTIALLIVLFSLPACTSMLLGADSTSGPAKKCQDNPRDAACTDQLRPK
jgi:hypothetical protein